MLWTIGMLGYAFEERVAAAAKHGFRRMSANAWEMEDILNAEGARGLIERRKFANEHGVHLAVLEPVLAWLPHSSSQFLRRVEPDAINEIGDKLGVDALLAIASRDTGASMNDLIKAFRALCVSAAGHACRIGVHAQFGITDVGGCGGCRKKR